MMFNKWCVLKGKSSEKKEINPNFTIQLLNTFLRFKILDRLRIGKLLCTSRLKLNIFQFEFCGGK